MSLVIGLKNVSSQSIDVDGTITLGNVYRRYDKKNSCGFRTFEVTSTGVTLQHQGLYHVTATLVGSGATAGVITVQVLENGDVVDGVFSSETITTPDTELRTFVIDYYVLIDSECILGQRSTIAKNISLQNTGVESTFTSVVFNVEKVV